MLWTTLVFALSGLNIAAARSTTLPLDNGITPFSTDESANGEVISHLFPECNGKSLSGKKKMPHSIPADTSCMTTPGLAIQILSPAICENGTRAQLAQFADKKCGRETTEGEAIFQLVDLEDKDVGSKSCITTMGNGDEGEKWASMAFWCEGVHKKEDDGENETKPDKEEEKDDGEKENKGAKGSVSESACQSNRAPFFSHPATDTCVNLKTSQLKIYSAGICANGTQSTLALYDSKSCAGTPSFKDITEDSLETCLNLEESQSYAFYCTGSLTLPTNPGAGNGNKQTTGSILHFFLILFCFLLFLILMAVLSVWAWVRKYGGSVNKILDVVKGFMKRDSGAIAL